MFEKSAQVMSSYYESKVYGNFEQTLSNFLFVSSFLSHKSKQIPYEVVTKAFKTPLKKTKEQIVPVISCRSLAVSPRFSSNK